MTALVLTPSGLGAPATRFGRTRTIAAVPEAPPTQVELLRAEIQRGAYTVDSGKVADAIVARLIAGASARERAS